MDIGSEPNSLTTIRILIVYYFLAIILCAICPLCIWSAHCLVQELVPGRPHLWTNGQLVQMQQAYGEVRNSVIHRYGRAFFLGRQEACTSGLVASDLTKTYLDRIRR